MQINLKTPNDVRVFAIIISLMALLGDAGLQFFFLPEDLFHRIIYSGSLVTLMVTMPIAFFIGQRMMDIHALKEQLEHAVNNDKLTGASTRVSFYQQLAGTGARSMALVFVDIDHFKGINDRFGHKAGDAALKAFAQTLIENCRHDDIVARFGGEEFVILLRGAGLDDGIAAAHRICAKVRGQLLDIDGVEIHITASFGVVELQSADQIDRALHMADLATLRAKREGRDRVCVFDPVLDRDGDFGFAAQ